MSSKLNRMPNSVKLKSKDNSYNGIMCIGENLRSNFIAYTLGLKEDGSPKKIINPFDVNQGKNTTLANYKKYLNNPEKFIIHQENIQIMSIGVWDFDEEYHTKEWIYAKFPFLEGHLCLDGTTRGFHIFTSNENFKTLKDATKIADRHKYGAIDLITRSIFIKTDDWEKYKTTEIKPIIDTDIIKIYPKYLSKIEAEEYIEDRESSEINLDEVKELLPLLKQERADDWQEWSLIIGALKKHNLKELAREFSKRSDKYSEEGFKAKWDTSNELHIGLLYNKVKQDNPEEFKKIKETYRFRGFELSTYEIDTFAIITISEKVAPYLLNNIVYSQVGAKGEWFVCDKDNLWIVVDKNSVKYFISQALEIGLMNFDKRRLKQIETMGDTDEAKASAKKQHNKDMKKCRHRVDTSTYKNTIKDDLQQQLREDDFHQKLNCNKYIFAFRNGMYDIRTCKFREGREKTDYITKYIDIDYIKKDFDFKSEYNESDREWLFRELKKICNWNDKHLYNYLCILGYCLSGDPSKYQSMYFLIGQSASNGKSIPLEALCQIMPCYVGKSNSQLLDGKFEKKHKFRPDLEKYRLVILEEMAKKSKLDGKEVKEIADGLIINNEVMHGTSRQTNINAKCMMVSNHSLDFDDPDAGGVRRYDHLQFDSSFQDETWCKKNNRPYIDDYENKWFKKDISFLDKLIARKKVLIGILMHTANEVYYEGLPPTPPEFEKEKDDTIEENFKFKNFINDKCEFGNDFCVLKSKIIARYKAEHDGNINERDVRDDMKTMGYKYDKNKKYDGGRGVYLKLQFKIEELGDEDIKQNALEKALGM